MSFLCDAYNSIDTECVNTGEVKTSNKTLITNFVEICTAIGFHSNGINFLAHVDGLRPNMESQVINHLHQLNTTNINKIHIWKGYKCDKSCPSFQIVQNIVNKLNGKKIYHNYNEHDTIIINSSMK